MDDGPTRARKPPGLSWERWIERQMSEAIERGSLVDHLNDRIRTVNRTTVSGTPTTLGPMVVDEVVARWHRMRGTTDDG